MAVEFKDYYATLGVSREAGEAEIKKAFRKLARQFHPDVATDKKAAEEKFKEINEAYDVLGDPEKRRKYDQLGARWQEGGFQPPPGWESAAQAAAGGPGYEFHFEGTGFSDFFEHFFGGGSRFRSSFQEDDFGAATARPRSPARGLDIEGDILVSLDEVREGSVRTISLQRVNSATGQSETQEIRVRIPVGIQEGQLIRIPGKGGDGTGGGPPGDVYLHVRYERHPHFRVREADLFHDIDLPPWDAVLGTHLLVPALDGSLRVRVPPGTGSGGQLRVRGKGLPMGKSGERGDLYITVNIHLPAQLTDEERSLWEKLRAVSRSIPGTK